MSQPLDMPFTRHDEEDDESEEEAEITSSDEESDEEGDVLDIGLLPRSQGTYAGIEERVKECLVFHLLKSKEHSMDRDDEVGWGRMYKIMTGSEWSHTTRRCISSGSKYYQYQYGGRKSDLGYDIHPFDQKNTREAKIGSQSVSLSINEVTDMCKEARDKVSERYGITHWTTPGYNALGRLTGIDERWMELALVLANVSHSSNTKKSQFMIRHLAAEAGWVPKFSEQQWAVLEASPGRQEEAYRRDQVFGNILLELGGNYVPLMSFPSVEDIPRLYQEWLEKEENLVHKRAKEASRRVSSEQYKLVATVSNDFNPDLESVYEVDKKWMETPDSLSQGRDFRKFLFDLRYKYGKNGTPIPSRLRHLVKAAQAPENRHMYLMMFDLDHNSDVAVEQKRRDQLELGRSNPSYLYYNELMARARLFSLLLTSVHMVKTWGEVPALLDPTRTQRSRLIMYRRVVALEKHALGEVCTMSGKELPDHVLEGHHNAEQYNIREGNTVHPTAKVCGRGGLYQCKFDYTIWSNKAFKEVGKKTRLSREWHRFTHFVLRNLDWFKDQGFAIHYPYEVERDKLVVDAPR